MSEVPRPRSNPAVPSTFATAGYLAGLIALWGFTSLFLDRDVVDFEDAGPLVGPAMAASACATVFLATLRAKRAQPALLGVGTGIAAYLVAAFVGGTGYSLVRDSFREFMPAAVHFGIGPFLIGAGILAGLVAAGTSWLIRPRPPRPPRGPTGEHDAL